MRKTELKRTPFGQKRKEPRITAGKEKPKKPKVPSVATLDDLFSRYIRAKANYSCELHGFGHVCSSQMQCSHTISRRFHSVRWDPLNAICACAAGHRWQHDHPVGNARALEVILGAEHLDKLSQRHLEGKKPSNFDKIEIAAFLRGQLKTLETK